jgi:cytochrome oxidase Cu insertion factor (SCO1/SenC/PrrC family)
METATLIKADPLTATWDKEERKMATLKKGDRAPTFNLTDQDGRHVKLADFNGKKVL